MEELENEEVEYELAEEFLNSLKRELVYKLVVYTIIALFWKLTKTSTIF